MKQLTKKLTRQLNRRIKFQPVINWQVNCNVISGGKHGTN